MRHPDRQDRHGIFGSPIRHFLPLLLILAILPACAMGTPSQISQKMAQTDGDGALDMPRELLLSITISGLPAGLTSFTWTVESLRVLTQELTAGQTARDTSAEATTDATVKATP